MKRIALLLLTNLAIAGAQTPAGPEFEVASIKPSPPGIGGRVRVGCRGGPGQDDPGLITCTHMSLSFLVGIAYEIDGFRLSAPDWMNQARFEISAKVPAGATRVQIPAMWRNLLAERFGLIAHHEMREMQQYRLVTAKPGPKLKPAVDAVHSDDTASRFDADGYPVFPARVPGMAIINDHAHWYAPRASMTAVVGMVSAQMQTPIADGTGLTGEYEVDLKWLPNSLFVANPDLSGQTLRKALESQLGLRLESTKGSVDFLVVDHANKEPTAN